MVSMTGSVSAGEKIMATAAKNITKVCLELGGKAPAIVMACDADLNWQSKPSLIHASLIVGKCVTVQNVFMYRKAFMISSSIGWVKRCRRFNLVTPLNATTLRWGR